MKASNNSKAKHQFLRDERFSDNPSFIDTADAAGARSVNFRSKQRLESSGGLRKDWRGGQKSESARRISHANPLKPAHRASTEAKVKVDLHRSH